ncbi:MAG: DNA polymerase I [Bacteroidetes bacterium]|nr:DNA polymerase I [Bacteroidota bacterium]
MPTKKLFLLDAYALIYRAYFALIKNPTFNSKGLNTSAILGFTNSLLDVLKKENPSHIGIVFDVHAPTFRHKMFSEYKANREEMPEDLRLAIPYIREVIKAFNIPIIEKPGFEADDVIGTMAKVAEQKGFVTYMMTPDKDYAQLVSDKIFMYKPRHLGKGVEIWDVDKVKEKFSINNPEQVIDILALWGDSVDNIPGCPGVGEKTSKKLIGEYGSVENIYNNLEDLKGKQKENFINFKEQVLLSKVLATIILDVDVPFDEEQLKLSNPDNEKLTSLFEEFEFRNLAKRYFPQQEKPKPRPAQGSLFDNFEAEAPTVSDENHENINTIKHDYYLVDNEAKMNDLLNLLLNQKEVCFDTETTSLDVHIAKLVGMSFAIKEHEAYYVPVPQEEAEANKIVEKFRVFFENEKIIKIGQNIKYDILVLRNYDIEVSGEFFDTMLAHYLIQPELRHNLDFLSEIYLNYKKVATQELIGEKGKNQLNMRDIPVDTVKEYACEDADFTFQLKNVLSEELNKKQLNELFNNIEMPLVKVLAEMENTGVKINVEALHNFSKQLRIAILTEEQEIYKLAGVEFNISSPKQLGEILFEKLKIVDNPKKTKTKQYSTGEEILSKLTDKHEIIKNILKYRTLKKLLTTYVDALPKLINAKTGRIHTSFNQAVTSTGRLSSKKPNLQNIPIREELGREIRKTFIPTDDEHLLISADYSQIELRIMAQLSQDPHMIAAFKQNEDIHSATASKIFKVNITDVTKEMRGIAKAANFGIIYKISAFGLSQNLNIPRKDAQKLIDDYFENYPAVKNFMDKSIEIAKEKGYSETIFGRKRYLNDINSNNSFVRGGAERNAINAPIQGSAADIIKIAMINVYKRFKEENLKSKMILQVHDELIFDVYKPEVDIVEKIVKHEMENAVSFDIPLSVDMDKGNNWLEAH